MLNCRKLIVGAGLLCSAFLMVAILSRIQRGQKVSSVPPPEVSRANLPWAGLSDSARRHFLDGEFKILMDVRKLPVPVLREFTDPSSSRLLIANPHEKWVGGDFIWDATLPRLRLILAGVASDRCFIHYEKGGRGTAYIVDFYGATADHEMKFLWRGFCGAPATNITDLRQCLVSAM